jgi:adenylate kinase
VRIVLVGPPGAGKGTQAQIIATELKIPHISTGDLFRHNVGNNTELGVKVKQYLDAGELVPDEVTVAMVRDRLSEPDAKDGFLLDGFPRNLAQAETLKKMLAEEGTPLTVVLELEVDEEEVVHRLSGRRTCRNCGSVQHVDDGSTCNNCGGELFQRDDDKEDVIRRRQEVYQTETAPLVAFYKNEGILASINANGPVEEVTARALAALQPYR